MRSGSARASRRSPGRSNLGGSLQVGTGRGSMMPVSAFSTAPTQRPGSLLLDRLWRDRRIFEPGSFAPRRQFVSPRKRSENERFGQNPRKTIYYSVEKGPTLG